MADDESVPKPGHFLPGGAGDAAGDDTGTTAPRPVMPSAARQLSLGKAQPVRPKTDPALIKPKPSPTTTPKSSLKSWSESSSESDDGSSGFGAPPPAPLPGAPGASLSGTKQLGGARRTGWHSRSSRTGAQFSSEPPPQDSQRKFSKQAVAAFSALALLLVGVGVTASMKLIDSYSNLVENPLAGPSVKPSELPPADPLPSPTVTVTVQPVPDAVRVKENKLYTAGRLASVNCKEPAIKPTTKEAVLKFYQAMLPCLNKSWAPLVRKAGYEFRAPKLVLFEKQLPSSCSGESDLAFYCGDDETITMRWERDVKNYKLSKIDARVDMMDTLAHEYGHHVQMLTHIMISSTSREGWATTEAAKLEENRRLELQASCFGAAFVGANKKSLEMTGLKLEVWQFQTKHSGDEYNPKKIRDHGSRKNQWYWAGPAFQTANPKSCNTFTAPAARVS
jgi:predicted metalloprotease